MSPRRAYLVSGSTSRESGGPGAVVKLAVRRLYQHKSTRQVSSLSSDSGRGHGEKSWSPLRLSVLSSLPRRERSGSPERFLSWIMLRILRQLASRVVDVLPQHQRRSAFPAASTGPAKSSQRQAGILRDTSRNQRSFLSERNRSTPFAFMS